jgi:hypothetical protein
MGALCLSCVEECSSSTMDRRGGALRGKPGIGYSILTGLAALL